MLNLSIYEPEWRGHHSRFLGLLLKGIRDLRSDLNLRIHTSQKAIFSTGFEENVRPHIHDYELLTDAINVEELYNRNPGRVEKAETFAKDIAAAASQDLPHHMYILTGEAGLVFMGFHKQRRALPDMTEVEALFCTTKHSRLMKQPFTYLRDRIWYHGLCYSPCTRALFISYWSYVWTRSHTRDPHKLTPVYLPDPFIKPTVELSPQEARRQLQIPEQGKYIGVVGCLDERKNLRTFLDSFFSRHRDPNLRILIGGRLCAAYSDFTTRYKQAIARGQLIIRDGYLDEKTFAAAQQSLDAVVMLYPTDNWASSGILLEAAGSGRQILTQKHGWIGYAARNFDLGVCIDSLATEEIENGIKRLLTRLQTPARKTLKAQQWLRLCTPEHFTKVLTHRLRERLGKPVAFTPLDWQDIYTR